MTVPLRAAALDARRFVTARAGRLELDGAAWLPRGVNSYPLLQHVGNGSLGAVRDVFAQALALERPLVRTLAFLDCGDNPARTRDADGCAREQGLRALDRLLGCAAEHGVRLLLVLTNNWPDFGGAPALLKMIAPRERLAKNAFWSDPRAIEAQLAYQHALATRVNSVTGVRYAQDPTIFAWELANEARCELPFWRRRTGPRTLARWAARMSAGLRHAGVQQLIAWGGSGYLGKHGEDLRVVAAEGGVDLLTLHMYGTHIPARRKHTRAEAAQAWGEATLRERSTIARQAGLPLLLEEANWKPLHAGTPDADQERAEVLGSWLACAHSLDIGTLPWMIGEEGRADHDGYLIRPDDHATCASLLRR